MQGNRHTTREQRILTIKLDGERLTEAELRLIERVIIAEVPRVTEVRLDRDLANVA